MKLKQYVYIVPVVIIIGLVIWQLCLYDYNLESIEDLIGKELYIKNVGDVVVNEVWEKNDKIIIIYDDKNLPDGQLSYAFFEEGIISGRYKEYHNFNTDEEESYEAIQVENVLLSIIITKDNVVENSFTIKKDWASSDIYKIFTLFLVYSFISSKIYNKKVKAQM